MAVVNHTNGTEMRGLGLSMVPPYAIWRNGGEMVAEFVTLAEAEAVFQTLTGGPAATPPAALLECFSDGDRPKFELIRCDGWIRLWKSPISLTADDRVITRSLYDITGKDDLHYLRITDQQTAIANFNLAVESELRRAIATAQ